MKLITIVILFMCLGFNNRAQTFENYNINSMETLYAINFQDTLTQNRY